MVARYESRPDRLTGATHNGAVERPPLLQLPRLTPRGNLLGAWCREGMRVSRAAPDPDWARRQGWEPRSRLPARANIGDGTLERFPV
jgi:hypothetical protein